MAFEITDRSALPYSAVCYLTVTFPNGLRVRGSGVVVGSNDVLTALHVVYSAPDGGWASSVSISPGADSDPFTVPFGSFSDLGSRTGRVDNWDLNGDGLLFESESQGDLALIGLRSRIGDVTGWLPVSTAQQAADVLALGYPLQGTGLMAATAQATPAAVNSVFSIDTGLGAGASGGPIGALIDGSPAVLGVLSSGASDLSVSRYAAFFGNGNFDWLVRTIASNDDLVAQQAQVRFYGQLDADDLRGNAGNNLIAANAGNDTLRGGGGSDVLDGGPGVDTVVLAGPRADYALQRNSQGWSLRDRETQRDGVLTLVGMERLQFADRCSALDLDGAAGTSAKLVGVILGPSAVMDARTIGVALAQLDQGTTPAELARFGLQQVLGPRSDTTAVISLLWSHLFDTLPTDDNLAFVRSLMAANGLDETGLAVYASALDLNLTRIGFAGLAETGLDYLPPA